MSNAGTRTLAIRRALRFLSTTPLHPQWFAYRGEHAKLTAIAKQVRGTVLDIGCAQQKPRTYLATDCTYVGLDYLVTASQWYDTRPQVFGDASALPFAAESFDSVLLLDVLEHLPDPHGCLSEIRRVLRRGGSLVLHVPFMYPTHDAPLDFQRWTMHGLRELSHRHGFVVVEESSAGRSLESAALLANLALSKVVLQWIRRRHPLSVMVSILPLFIIVTNLLAWGLSRFTPNDDFMPHGFKLLLQRH